MKGDSVMRAGKRRGGVLAALLAVLVALCAPVVARAGVITTPGNMAEGVNILRTGASSQTFNVADGQALMINSPADGSAIEFSDCTFNLAGGTVKISGNQDGISYNNGETVTKLFVGGNVTFNNCTFVTAEGARKTTTAGYDAAVYFFSGDINLQGCALKAEGYNGQFLGLYGSSGAVTFRDCDISTTNNRNGWSYAMYAGSVLRLLDGSTMKATGASTDGGNINAFYSGDNRTGYDAIFVENSTIDFSDNAAGGFSINNVNIHVKNSAITVNDNKGNACNSGVWYLEAPPSPCVATGEATDSPASASRHPTPRSTSSTTATRVSMSSRRTPPLPTARSTLPATARSCSPTAAATSGSTATRSR